MNPIRTSRRQPAPIKYPNGVTHISPGSDRRGQQGRGPTLGNATKRLFFPLPFGRGPRIAKRSSLIGQQNRGGVGNALGQGEGSVFPPLIPSAACARIFQHLRRNFVQSVSGGFTCLYRGVCERGKERRKAVCSQKRKRISCKKAPVPVGVQHSTEERNCGFGFRPESCNRVGCLVSALLPAVFPERSSADSVLKVIIDSSGVAHYACIFVIDPVQQERKSVCSNVPNGTVGPDVAFRGRVEIIVGQPLTQLLPLIHRLPFPRPQQHGSHHNHRACQHDPENKTSPFHITMLPQ